MKITQEEKTQFVILLKQVLKEEEKIKQQKKIEEMQRYLKLK